MAKTTPYPPCTPAAHYARAGRGVTAFWLKHQDRDRCLRRVTSTKLYRRAGIRNQIQKFFLFANFIPKFNGHYLIKLPVIRETP